MLPTRSMWVVEPMTPAKTHTLKGCRFVVTGATVNNTVRVSRRGGPVWEFQSSAYWGMRCIRRGN